jgi:hypothetical protein
MFFPSLRSASPVKPECADPVFMLIRVDSNMNHAQFAGIMTFSLYWVPRHGNKEETWN